MRKNMSNNNNNNINNNNKITQKCVSNEIYENLPCRMEEAANMAVNSASINIGSHSLNLRSKEMLYATPLRKSDRQKPPICPRATAPPKEKDDNSNVDELEDRRIRDFLKDTTQMHKKIELHKEYQSSNFSYLARKEHFANLVHQNILLNESLNSTNESFETDTKEIDEASALLPSTASAIDEEVKQNNVNVISQRHFLRADETRANPMLNREWVLKKIAMCLEQRASKKPVPAPPQMNHDGGDAAGGGFFPRAVSTHQGSNTNLPQLGYLVLGSNGSGKTSICNDIINGTSGTKGMLNRRLLACYFVNSQNPECHSLSMFIRSIILQILSHSTFACDGNSKKEEDNLPEADQYQALFEEVVQEKQEEIIVVAATAAVDKDTPPTTEEAIDKELEDVILSEIKLNERVAELSSNIKKKVIRQQSDPIESLNRDKEVATFPYTTHPPSQKKMPKIDKCASDNDRKEKTLSPGKKVSKIPVPIGRSTSSGSGGAAGGEDSKSPERKVEEKPKENEAVNVDEEEILDGGGEGIAEIADDKLEEEINREINEDVTIELKEEDHLDHHTPPPLPKTKNCRQVIADGYYEMLISNPEIFESITVDSIEKNPDDCFKKAILFPLLELNPPKNALLLLIDSIDENYIQDGNLISTLKGKQVSKSRNIAELLSNHIHLLPKWLFLVCTAKKQNKNITKLFTAGSRDEPRKRK